MNEQQFSAWLRKKLEGYVTRIENTIGSGIPDIHWAAGGHTCGDYWIETKVSHRSEALLRKEQYAWGSSRASMGCRVRIVLLNSTEDSVLVWKFPLTIERSSKYLRITSPPMHYVVRQAFHSGLLVG